MMDDRGKALATFIIHPPRDDDHGGKGVNVASFFFLTLKEL